MMGSALQLSFHAVGDVAWLELIKALAPIATAVIALLALRNWQRQDRAKRQAEFLDALIEAMHGYIVDMHKPVELLRMAKIGMASHVRNWEESETDDKALKGAIQYITSRGEQDGKRMTQALNAVEPSVIKLRSLMTKGQIFSFPGYAKCKNAVTLLTWHFDRLLSFNSMIESPTWNWEHPEVSGLLAKVMAIDPDDIRQSIEENDVAVIEFARDAYNRLYG